MSMPDGPAPLLLTIAQAASVLGISRTTVYELLKDGELYAIHIRRSSGGSRQLVTECLGAWSSNRGALGTPPTPISGYGVDARHIEAAFGGVRLNKLTVDHVETLWKQMSATREDGRTRIASIPHVR